MLKLFCLMYYKCSELKPYLIKSSLILFEHDRVTCAEILVKTTFLDILILSVPM